MVKKKRSKVKNKSKSHILRVRKTTLRNIIILLFVIVIGLLVYKHYKDNYCNNCNLSISSIPAFVSPANQKQKVNGNKNAYFSFYYLKVKRIPNSPIPNASEGVGNYLARVMNFPSDYQGLINIGLGVLMYDTRVSNPYKDPWNANYYLIVNATGSDVHEGLSLNTSNIYSDQSVTIQVSKPSMALYPYMSSVDGNFCKTNSDCTLRPSLCTDIIAPYNYYEWFAEQGGCPGGGSQIHYNGVKCLSNICTGY